MEAIYSSIRKKYTLERELAAWRWETQQLEREVPRRNYELREAKFALAEYESFGLHSALDKLSGKYEARWEALAKAAKDAQAALDSAKWQLDSARSTLASLEQEAESQPTREQFFSMYPDLEYLKQQDGLLCAERLGKLLKENEKHLQQARDWAENRNADFGATNVLYEKSAALTKGADCAREICGLLNQLGEDGYVVDIHNYFQAPDGYVAGAARQYGQLDRINYAIQAVRTTQAIVQELTLQLKDN